MVPMIPMLTVDICCVERICGGTPHSGSILSGQDKPGGARARELSEHAGDELASAALRIEDPRYPVVQLRHGDRFVAMAIPPGVEQFGYALALRVMGFYDFDLRHRIGTSERQQRIPYPLAPNFKAAERTTSHHVDTILSAPPPNG